MKRLGTIAGAVIGMVMALGAAQAKDWTKVTIATEGAPTSPGTSSSPTASWPGSRSTLPMICAPG